MKLLTFNKYYEGEFGDLEGPITTVIGLYDNEEDIKQAKITSELVEIEFETQYGAAKDHFELTDLPLNTMVHTPYSVRKKKWQEELEIKKLEGTYCMECNAPATADCIHH